MSFWMERSEMKNLTQVIVARDSSSAYRPRSEWQRTALLKTHVILTTVGRKNPLQMVRDSSHMFVITSLFHSERSVSRVKNLIPSSTFCMRSLTFVRDDINFILRNITPKNLLVRDTVLTEQCHSERLCREESSAKREYNVTSRKEGIPRRATGLTRNDK